MGKLFCFGILLFISQKSFGYDINEIRELALQHIEDNVDYLRQTINQTLWQLHYKKQNLQQIVLHEKSTGEAVTKSGQIDVHNAEITGSIAGYLLKSYPFVFECISNVEKQSIFDIDSYHEDKFIQPLNNYEAEAEKIQDDDVRKWTDEYNVAVNKFSEQYERVVNDIINSNDEAEIGWRVREFDLLCRDFSLIINNINDYLNKTQYELLLVLDQLVNSLRNYIRNRFNVAQISIKDCINSYNAPNPNHLAMHTPVINDGNFPNFINRPNKEF